MLPFIAPKARVFKWKDMPFGVANARAFLQELMNKMWYIFRCRPLVQELISPGAEMDAHIDDVSLGPIPRRTMFSSCVSFSLFVRKIIAISNSKNVNS